MAAKVKALQEWCRRQCEGYRDVNITNMTSSWKSGLAFCAIIHRYRPDLIDYDQLKKDDVYTNNKMAFDVARDKLGIPALLDPEDMVIMKVPDKLCIVTYVAQYYNYFHNKQPGGGPVVKSAVKRTTVYETLSPESKSASPPDVKRIATNEQVLVNSNTVTASRRGGTMDDRCRMCHGKVYLLERFVTPTGELFHRHCYRGQQRTSTMQKTSTKASLDKQNEVPGVRTHVSSSHSPEMDTLSHKVIDGRSATSLLTTSVAADQLNITSVPGTPEARSLLKTDNTTVMSQKQAADVTPNHCTTCYTTSAVAAANSGNSGTVGSKISSFVLSTPSCSRSATPSQETVESKPIKWTFQLPQSSNKKLPDDSLSSNNSNLASGPTIGNTDKNPKSRDSTMVAGLLKSLAEARNRKQVDLASAPDTAGTTTPLSTGSRLSPINPLTSNLLTPVSSAGSSPKDTMGVPSARTRYSNEFSLSSKQPITEASGSMGKTDWQLEAERRQTARNGKSIEPEKQPWHWMSATPAFTPKPSSSDIKTNAHNEHPGTDRQLGLPLSESASKTKQDRGTTWQVMTSSDASNRDAWQSRYFGKPSKQHGHHHSCRSKSDSSEPPMTTQEILKRLEELDLQLRVIESQGRELEDKIRKGSDAAMDDDTDNNMEKWFGLIKQRHELIREESYLMYRKRQQELEDLHEELEYQLRCLLEKPEILKTVKDKQDEESLLAELIVTVSQRNNIIDSIEVDRLRYLEEDQQLEEMMAESGI